MAFEPGPFNPSLTPLFVPAKLSEVNMAILTVEGVVENGQIRLRDYVALPEHTKVYVIIPDVETAPPAHVYSPRLVHPEQALDFAKQVIEVAADAEL
jgi:hypothetical protein